MNKYVIIWMVFAFSLFIGSLFISNAVLAKLLAFFAGLLMIEAYKNKTVSED
jgi:succinate-acetate transporter protein